MVFAVWSLALLPGETKIVYIPDKINIEANAMHATAIRNMSEIGLYKTNNIYFIDDFIYISDILTPQVIKLSLQGKVVGRFGRKGEGPGESKNFLGISRFKKNLAIIGFQKLIICNKDLQLQKEIRLKRLYFGLFLTVDNKVYFYNTPPNSDYYFDVYTDDFKFLKNFGLKNMNTKKNKTGNKKFYYSSDRIRNALYLPQKNGFWVSFKDRYGLRFYKDETIVVDIKAKKPVFTFTEQERMGIKVMASETDWPILIAEQQNQLYYFFKKGDSLFCDVFDLSDNYRFLHRLKVPFVYRKLTHVNDYIFYGLRYDESKENVFLDKIKIKRR
jgi:hypothetical protein